MSVPRRRQREDTEPTPASEYVRWRFSREDRYGSCPSLEEAFTAGWRACPQDRFGVNDAATVALAQHTAWEHGYNAGYAKAERHYQARQHALADRERILEERERAYAPPPLAGVDDVDLTSVGWSPHEAIALKILCSQPERTASSQAIHLAIWGDGGKPNSVRVLISIMRAKLPKDWCLGREGAHYRLHRIQVERSCPLSRHAVIGGAGGAYVPRCRAWALSHA